MVLMKYISLVAIPLFIVIILTAGLIKKVDIFSAFVEGAKEGLLTSFRILPYLAAMLCAISIFRNSGAIDILTSLLSYPAKALGLLPETIPLAILRPISGSASLAMLQDIFANYGTDTIIGQSASIIMGSTETTLYTMAIYLGAIQIKKSNYTLKIALMTDFIGIIIASYIARFFFA